MMMRPIQIFLQLFKVVLGWEGPRIKSWIEKRQIYHDMQNEMIKTMDISVFQILGKDILL